MDDSCSNRRSCPTATGRGLFAGSSTELSRLCRMAVLILVAGWLASGCEMLGLSGDDEFAQDAKLQAKVMQDQAKELEDGAKELVKQADQLKK